MDTIGYWKDLVEQRNTWIAHNFPNSDKEDTILGVVEEYGELTHAVLKDKQSIRGSHDQHVEDMKDAIGDMSVYLMGVMSYSTLVPRTGTGFPYLDTVTQVILAMSRPVSMICHFQFKPQVLHPMEDLVGMMLRFCELQGWDYYDLVEDTWLGVSQRDWLKFPGDGRTH